jgi:hypothetical protein
MSRIEKSTNQASLVFHPRKERIEVLTLGILATGLTSVLSLSHLKTILYIFWSLLTPTLGVSGLS